MPKQKLSRRKFMQISGSTLTALGLFRPHAHSKANTPGELTVYIGTYTTSTKSEGIYIYRLNMSNGALKHFKTIKGVVDPSYLTIDRKRRFLYVVNEVSQFEGKQSGAISSFAID